MLIAGNGIRELPPAKPRIEGVHVSMPAVVGLTVTVPVYVVSAGIAKTRSWPISPAPEGSKASPSSGLQIKHHRRTWYYLQGFLQF